VSSSPPRSPGIAGPPMEATLISLLEAEEEEVLRGLASCPNTLEDLLYYKAGAKFLKNLRQKLEKRRA